MLDPQVDPPGRQIALAAAFVLSLLVVPQGKRKLEQYLAALMDKQSGWGLSSRMRILVADMRAQWRGPDRRITAFDAVRACRRGQARLLLAMVLTLLAHLSPPESREGFYPLNLLR